ncbi:adenine nucleotide transporter [Amylocystis lapponica]|nr:adenine nucleotide transporter [Amylocystis lapponica]
MSSKPTQLTPFGYALAGALGGCFSNAVVYPLDIVKTRIQAATATFNDKGEKEELSVITALIRILKEEGIAGYYRGFGATMLNTFSMHASRELLPAMESSTRAYITSSPMACTFQLLTHCAVTEYAYFFFYSFVRTSYIKRLASRRAVGSKAPPLSTAAELILGAIAGALAQIFTIPVSVIATRQQIGHKFDRPRKALRSADKGKASSEDGEKEQETGEEKDEYDDSFLGVAREIVEEEGVGGLWLGIRPGLVLTVNPAITYGVFERVKSVMLLAQERAGGSAKLNPWTAFLVGALSKTLATVVTYPYIMAKVRIQARTADVEDAVVEHHSVPPPHTYHHPHGHHVGALTILERVWRKQGFLGWYQGMGAQITKAVLSQALLFVSKDQFEHWALAIMVLLYQLRHRTKA